MAETIIFSKDMKSWSTLCKWAVVIALLMPNLFGCGKKSPVSPIPYSIIATDKMGVATGIVIVGSVAYISTGSEGLYVPAAGILLPGSGGAEFWSVPPPTGMATYKAYVLGSYAYIACIQGVGKGDTAFSIGDISSINFPKALGSCRLRRDGAWDVVALGSYAFVAEGTENNFGYLEAVNVSNPLQPAVAATCSLQYFDVRSLSLDAANHVLWLAGGESRIIGINITDPLHPAVMGSCDLPGAAQDISISYPYAYVADAKGLEVVRIDDPMNPHSVSQYPLPDSGTGSLVGGGCVFVTGKRGFVGGLGRVYIFDILDPLHPSLSGQVDIPQTALDICNYGNYAFIANGESIVVIQLPFRVF